MDGENRLTDLESALLILIKQFVERQPLVLEIIQDLRPDLLPPERGGLDPKIGLERYRQLKVQYKRSPHSGFWGANDEWEYYFHGRGCRLTHVETGEPIEWDVGDLRRFDKTWFAYWLVWKFEHAPQENDVQRLKQWYETIQEKQDLVTSRGVRFFHHLTPFFTTLHDKNYLKSGEHRMLYVLINVI